jgi:hypothetical protein
MGQIMMCAPCMSRELLIFKIIIIYIFLEFIDNKKLKKCDVTDDNVYTMYV